MDTYVMKKGHPIIGFLLGAAGIAVALLLVFLTGLPGSGIALILGGLALFMGIRSRRGGRGIPSILAGLMAILLSFTMTCASVKSLQMLHEKAVQSGQAPLITEYGDNPYLGLLGIALSIPDAENSFEELSKEITMLHEQTDNINSEVA